MSKLLKQSIERPASIGGQALIEGVMMRGSKEMAIAVRTPDHNIVIKKELVDGIVKKYKLNKIPLIRGAVTLIDSMVIGIRSLTYSAELAELEEETGEEQESTGFFYRWMEKIFKDKIDDFVIYSAVALAIVISVGFFMLLPTFLTSFLRGYVPNHFALNVIEGLLRLGLFVLYVVAVSRMKEIKRVFQYHGAEHKVIYCYEKGEELTVENSQKYTTLHPRCGTSFLFVVMMVSMILFSLVGWPNPFIRVAARLIMLPLVAGISYEIIKLAGTSQSFLMKIVSYPGMMMQKLTTREPDDSQIEVAIAALKNVLVEEEGNIL
jgi:uncharacterized protein YqhQ